MKSEKNATENVAKQMGNMMQQPEQERVLGGGQEMPTSAQPLPPGVHPQAQHLNSTSPAHPGQTAKTETLVANA